MIHHRLLSAKHKGLRNAMSRLTFYAGSMNYRDPDQLYMLKMTGRDFGLIYNDMITYETEYIMKPLVSRSSMAAEHAEIFAESVSSIGTIMLNKLSEMNGLQNSDEEHEMYVELTQYHNVLLTQLHFKDLSLEMHIQHTFSPVEILEMRLDMLRRMTYPMSSLWMKYIVPAQNDRENIQLLSELRTVTSPEQFGGIMQMLQGELFPQRYSAIVQRLK